MSVNTNIERWKPVVGFEGLYEVSDQGRVKSLARTVTNSRGVAQEYEEKILGLEKEPRGYVRACLSKDGKRTKRRVHVMVLESFVGPRPAGMVACHENDIGSDNRVENLRWDTQKGNIENMVRLGGHAGQRKTHCPRGHALSDVNVIPSEASRGWRACLACARTSNYVKNKPEYRPYFKGSSDRVYSAILDDTYVYGYPKYAAAEAVVASIFNEMVSQLIDDAA